jgi:putative DNA primase/helicase
MGQLMRRAPDEVLQVRAEKLPWHDVAGLIPADFDLRPEGLFNVRNGEERRVSGPIWIHAMTRDGAHQVWGVLAGWQDHDGKLHDRAFPVAMLHESRGQSLMQVLAASGLLIQPRATGLLVDYLAAFNPPRRVQSVARLGWLSGEQLVYVIPEGTLGSVPAEPVVFQPERNSPAATAFRAASTLDDWGRLVATPCRENPLLVFCLCAAFSPPLAKFANLDSGGFHLYGNSSKGKTTALQVAASVWGNGADPAVSDASSIRRWNSTANALEGIAAAHNDGLLALDEMGTCDAMDFGRVVYNLFGGQGKARMGKDAHLLEQRAWRVQVLSTGEISTRQKIEEGTRKPAKAGQLARLIDIPIGDAMVVATAGREPGQFVDCLKRATGQNYGTAGPEFLRNLADKLETVRFARQDIQQRVDKWIEGAPVGHLESVEHRALHRFALVAVAGRLAREFGILPISGDDVDAAVIAVWNRWRGEGDSLSDSVRGVASVREFIMKHPARFADPDRVTVEVRDLAGYHDSGRGLWLFTPGGFREACGGQDPLEVARELARRGFLFKNDADRLRSKHTIKAREIGRIPLYAVRNQILEADDR